MTNETNPQVVTVHIKPTADFEARQRQWAETFTAENSAGLDERVARLRAMADGAVNQHGEGVEAFAQQFLKDLETDEINSHDWEELRKKLGTTDLANLPPTVARDFDNIFKK